MSGRDSSRGFIFQSIIAMIECLNRSDWDEIKLEPETKLDKVDIQLYRGDKIILATQVKSSKIKFERHDVRTWLNNLKNDTPDAEEILLYLIGDNFSEACNDYIMKNAKDIKKISFANLEDICAGKLVNYIKIACPGGEVRVRDLNIIDATLFSLLQKNSKAQNRVTYNSFKEAFLCVFAIQPYDRLMSIFENDRKRHTSIRMMNPDPVLFPKGLPEIKSDKRQAVVSKETPRSIKDMILDSWKYDTTMHILLIGEGGIGKTVAMLTLPKEEWFCQYRIPVVYVPLQRLAIYEGRLDRYLLNKIGSDDFDRIIELANRVSAGHPQLILLLDGFNEVPEKDKVKIEKHIREWMERPGVQIITTSRIGFSLENSFLKYQLQPLPKEVVRAFLLTAGEKDKDLPKDNDPIWKVINVPLMLTLYTQIDTVKKLAELSSAYQLLDWKETDNAAHIIWNYLQTEIYRYIDIMDISVPPLQYTVALIAIAPYICCQMNYRFKFYITREEFLTFITDALLFYDKHQNLMSKQLQNIRQKYWHYSQDDVFREELAGKYLRILVDYIALFQERENCDLNGNVGYTYSIVHQNFRDALAGFFISSCLLEEINSKDKRIVLDYANSYVKNYIAEFLSIHEMSMIWEKHRKEEPEDGHISWIMLDIIGRQRNYDFRDLNFSGLDLTKTNLRGILSKRVDISPLPSIKEQFEHTKLSCDSLCPKRHLGNINTLTYSPDGRFLVSGSDNGIVRIREIESGESRILEGPTDEVLFVTYSPDGRFLVRISFNAIWVWDLECEERYRIVWFAKDDEVYNSEGKRLGDSKDDINIIHNLKNIASNAIEDYLNRYEQFPDTYNSVGKFLASCNEDTVQITNLENGEKQVLRCSAMYSACAVNQSGRHIVCLLDDGTIQIWNLESWKSPVLKVHKRFDIVVFSPDGRYLACSKDDDSIQIWDLESGKNYILGGKKRNVQSLMYSPNGKYLIGIVNEDTVCIWDLESKKRHLLEGYAGSINDITCSPDGRYLVSGEDDGIIQSLNLESGEIHILEGMKRGIESLMYSSDGKYLVSSVDDGTVRFWELDAERCFLLNGHRGQVESVAYSIDGRHLVSGARDGTVRVWNPKSGEGRILEAYSGWIGSVVYSQDGRYLAYGGKEGAVWVKDLRSKRTRMLEGHRGSIESLAFSSDRRHLASCADDCTVRIWNLESGECKVLRRDKWVNSISYSPDGIYLAISESDCRVRILNLENGEEQTLEDRSEWVNIVAYSPDGEKLASGEDDGTVLIRNLKNGQTYPLKGHEGPVYSMAYSPDGKYIASGGEDGTVRIWDLKEYQEIKKYVVFPFLNLIGANFELAEINEKDKLLLKAAGARVHMDNTMPGGERMERRDSFFSKLWKRLQAQI